MSVRRYDRGELRPPTRLENGWLRADAFLTRTGVFEYFNSDGSVRRELRPPEEVFAPESLATLQLVPLTSNHPPVPLDAQNTATFAVGSVGESIARADDKVAGPLLITNAQAVNDVLSGKAQEISCGYDCDVEESSGVFEGIPYTRIQRKIRYNHVALVPRGRAGPDVRIRLDSIGAVEGHLVERIAPGGPVKTKRTFSTRRGDSITVELEDDQVAAFEELLEQLQDAKKERDDLKGKIADVMKDMDDDGDEEDEDDDEDGDEDRDDGKRADAKGSKKRVSRKRFDALQARLDTVTEELKQEKKLRTDAEDPKRLQGIITARVALLSQAAKVLGTEAKLDEMDDLAIKKAVIQKLQPEAKLDGKSADYVHARFDAAVELVEKSPTALDELRRNLDDPHRTDAHGDPLERAAADYRNRLTKSHEAPLSGTKRART